MLKHVPIPSTLHVERTEAAVPLEDCRNAHLLDETQVGYGILRVVFMVNNQVAPRLGHGRAQLQGPCRDGGVAHAGVSDHDMPERNSQLKVGFHSRFAREHDKFMSHGVLHGEYRRHPALHPATAKRFVYVPYDHFAYCTKIPRGHAPAPCSFLAGLDFMRYSP